MSTDHYLACHKCKESIHVAQDGLSGYTFYRGETECMKALGQFLYDHAHHPLQLVYEQEYEDYREVEWKPNRLLGNPEEMNKGWLGSSSAEALDQRNRYTNQAGKLAGRVRGLPSLREQSSILSSVNECLTPDERHEDVVRRYPGGLTPAQFRHETLASADKDGKLDPPALADWFKRQSLLIGMWMDGLIELRNKGRDQPMWPWFITSKGRASPPPSTPKQGEGE